MNNFLKERRKELGLTMLDVANIVGVSEGTVSRWESGHIANMKRNHIAKLARTLNISPNIIIGINDDEMYGDTLDDMLQALSIELNVSYDTLRKTFEEKIIPNGFSNSLNKKNLKHFFQYHLNLPTSEVDNASLLTNTQAELLEASNTLTDDEIADVLKYIDFIKSRRE